MSTRAQYLDVGPYWHASGEVTLPGSKSISNRTLLLAALCGDKTRVQGLLKSDDTDVMIKALRQLGAAIDAGENAADEVVVDGTNTFSITSAELFLTLGRCNCRTRQRQAREANRAMMFSGKSRQHQRRSRQNPGQNPMFEIHCSLILPGRLSPFP